jgi:hypothetical protein
VPIVDVAETFDPWTLTALALDMLMTWPWQLMTRSNCRIAAWKGLTVNVQKSYIVNLHAYRNSAVPVFRLCNQELEERFSYLPGNVVWQAHELTPCCVPCSEVFWCSYTHIEWKKLVLTIGFLTGLMRYCGFSRHMHCQLACMPVWFGLCKFWSTTMFSAILCRSHTWRS